MDCDRAQALLSARMDGAHVTRRQAEVADVHLAGCTACRAFQARSARVRTAVRIRPAADVPDLVDPIMRTVTAEAARRPARPTTGRVSQLLAAALAGVIVGSVLVGGPWEQRSTRSVAIASVARGIRSVARSVEAYSATYSIEEFGLAPQVPERRLRMELAFLAPQRFRLEVRDLTSYPSGAWTPTDITYVEDMPATFLSSPSGCPATLQEICPPTQTTVTTSSPYSAAAPLPADLILPIATFGSTRGIEVIGEEDIDGRRAVRVELSFDRAAPLFPFLRLGGTWRPFYGGDRVVLWLDAESWFPLEYTVFPSTAPERRQWEMRFGRAPERVDIPILDVRVESTTRAAPDASAFAIPRAAAPVDVRLVDAPGYLGYLPATPTSPGQLRLASVIAPAPEAPTTPRSLLVYTDGLDYLRIAERPGWRGPGPFGPVEVGAERVELAGGSVAYYEPPADGLGRRLAIHGERTDLYLDTNLTRRRLLAIAASIPVGGLPFPPTWSGSSP
jgi:outer membrane lipoprotein-sorting protein